MVIFHSFLYVYQRVNDWRIVWLLNMTGSTHRGILCYFPMLDGASHSHDTMCGHQSHQSGIVFWFGQYIYIYVSISMDCFDMFWPYIRGVMIHSLFSSRNELHWPLVGSILSNHQFKRCFIQTNTIWGALYQNSHFNGVYDGQPWHLWVFPQFFDKNKSLSNKLIKHVSHSPWFYPKKISNISQNFPLPLIP